MSLLAEVHLPNLTIPGNLFMAPMAGYTDAAFRALCVEQGAFLCFTEMVSAEGLARGGEPTWALLSRAENEIHWGVQLFGSEPRALAAAVNLLAPLRPSLLDLNCGCSVPKVLKAGAGASLLRSPERLAALVRAMRENSETPVTVKIRSGWDSASLNYPQVAEAASAPGRPRCACTRARGPRASRAAPTGPRSPSSSAGWARRCSAPGTCSPPTTRCASPGKPAATRCCWPAGRWAIPSSSPKPAGCSRGCPPLRPLPPPSASRPLCGSLAGAVLLYGEAAACREMRKHFCAYTRGLPGGARLRSLVVAARAVADYQALAAEYLGKKDLE